MKQTKKTMKLVSAKLLSLGMALWMTVAACIPPVCATATEPPSVSENAVTEDTAHTTKIPLSHLLAAMTDMPLSEAESQWLDAEGSESLPASLSLIYDSAVPHTSVSVEFPSDGVAKITATTYTGTVHATVWTPSSVTVAGQTYPLTSAGDGIYQAEIPTEEPVLFLQVQYGAHLTVSREDADLLRQAAYKRAEALNAAMEAYHQAIADHTAATEAYNAYRVELQKYSAALKEYNAYQQALQAYEKRLATYQAYLKEMDAYEAEYALYEAYLNDKAAYDKALDEYTDFVNNPAAYEKKYLAYCAYLAELEKISAQLALIDSCFVSDAAGHVLNSTLNGPTVKTVVERQDELVAAGCNAQDIANADQSTKILTALLKEYPRKEEDAVRYAYYIKHYTEIRDHVTLLYTSLSRLYGNDGVPDILDMQGKKERYWQFVAQLYALSCAMEDTVSLNMQWSISGESLTALLDPCFILKDTNAATPASAYPAYMEEVVSPSQMKKPTPPAVVEKPVAPLKVTEPQKPTAVSKPTIPPIVSAPGPYPDRPLFSMYEEALVNAFTANQLPRRPAATEAVSYPLTLSVDQVARWDDIPTAYFYDSDRMTLLSEQTVNTEGEVTWPKAPTPPEEKDGIVYSFSGWVDDEGRAYIPNDEAFALTESKYFYAVYTSTKASYTVTWDVEGALTHETYDHGEIPVYQGTPTKAEDGENIYTFIGWTPVVRPATQNVTYTAVFSAQKKFFEVQWVIGDDRETETYPSGELPTYLVTPTRPMDGRYVYIFSHWSPEITAVHENAVYTAVFEAIDLLDGDDQASLTETDDEICVIKPDRGGDLCMSIRHLAAYASEHARGLLLNYGRISIMLSEETVRSLCTAQAETLKFCKGEGDAPLMLCFYDAEGQEISVNDEVKITVPLPTDQAGRLSDASGETVSSVQNGMLTAILHVGAAYTLKVGHTVTVHMAGQGEENETGGIYTLSSELASAGETVWFSVQPSPGYDVKSVVVRDKFGGVISHAVTLDGKYSFIMPTGNADITVQMIPHLYTVKFCVGDAVISQGSYHYGDMPVIPPDPTRVEDRNYRYTFVGWTPTVTAVMGDTVYEAEFLKVPLQEPSAVEESKLGIVQLALIGVLSAAVVYAGILVPYVILLRKKELSAESAETGKGDK